MHFWAELHAKVAPKKYKKKIQSEIVNQKAIEVMRRKVFMTFQIWFTFK